jgi:hypothetical protein
MTIQAGHSAFSDPPAVTHAVQRDEQGRFASDGIGAGNSALSELAPINALPVQVYEASESEGPPFGSEAVIERSDAGQATSEQAVEPLISAAKDEMRHQEEGWDPAGSAPQPLRPWDDSAAK